MTDDPLGPPPVEPLSDVTWARVERGLWARMDSSASIRVETPPSRRWQWIVTPLVAIAAVIAIVVIVRDPSIPKTEVVTLPPAAESDVRVVAPATASTTATFEDAHIELAPASAMVMRRDRPATVLERGAAWFAVAPRIDRPPFVVLAGDATVRVLGTRFHVARLDDRVTVEVDHGVVEVQFRGRLHILKDHQTWSSEAPERVTLLALADPAQRAPIAPVKPAPTPDLPAVKPAIKPTPQLRKPAPTPDVPAVKPAIKPTSELPKPDLDQAKFEQLSVLEKSNPQAAMTGYLALSQRSSRWAANALYAAGRLAADRKDPRATTLLAIYVRRFPSGANVEDARALLARLQ